MPNYPYDVFVSYATRDDQPFPGVTKEGWITTFVKQLGVLLVQKLERREVAIWTDRSELQGNDELTPNIREGLAGCATMLMFLSPQYLASSWCQKELETFLRSTDDLSRVFLVELTRLQSKPPRLQDLKGYAFWDVEDDGKTPRRLAYPKLESPRDDKYIPLINKLSDHLAHELRRQRPAHAGAPAPADDGRPVVYLAEPTDDLELQCHEVRCYLEQAGIRVVPDVSWAPPREPDGYCAAVNAALEGVHVFAQLLSELPGKRPPALPEGYLGAQHRLAGERRVKVVQWRRRDLDVSAVALPAHRARLEAPTVIADGLEEFKRLVTQAARQAATPIDPDKILFCRADASDVALCTELNRVLEKRQIGYVWANETKSSLANFKSLLAQSHAFVLVYGNTPLSWVQEQLLLSRKYLPRDNPVAVFEFPPPDKPNDLGIHLPRLSVEVIDCQQGWNDAAFERFLGKLPARPAAGEADSWRGRQPARPTPG